MFPWNPAEAKFVQSRTSYSAANALSVSTAAVPAGKVWIVTGFGYQPDTAETKVINIVKLDSSGTAYTLLNPISLALNPHLASFVEQGMEVFLLPGEYVQVKRDSATAGSAMAAYLQTIEIDLPLYEYEEPQIVKRTQRALSSIRQNLSGGLRGSITRPPTLSGGDRGGRTGPLPK